MQDKIYFDDLVILKVIQEQQGELDYSGVSMAMLSRLANAWLIAHQVPENYCPEFGGGMSQIQKRLGLLKKLGLVRKVGSGRGSRTTEKGNDLLQQLGEWRSWFLSAPLNDEHILFEQAVFAEQFRTEI